MARAIAGTAWRTDGGSVPSIATTPQIPHISEPQLSFA